MYEPAPGDLIADRFVIERRIGSGGMGTVFGAQDAHTKQQVALKLMHPNYGEEVELARFARESDLLAGLSHPGIVAYVAHGSTASGQYFLAMEWLHGEELATRLSRAPLSVPEAVTLLQRVADTLAFAHERGIIHRDLKPSNLFLPGGRVDDVKLLDFGIARRLGGAAGVTRTGMVVGTPAYMAPEQARGDPELGPAADIFSLGCVLYECLTGVQPFVAEHLVAVLMGILRDDPVQVKTRRPQVSRQLSDLVHRMLAKDPKARPADLRALAREAAALDQNETLTGDLLAL